MKKRKAFLAIIRSFVDWVKRFLDPSLFWLGSLLLFLCLLIIISFVDWWVISRAYEDVAVSDQTGVIKLDTGLLVRVAHRLEQSTPTQ